MNELLAERIRPKTLEDYISQQHLVGKNGILTNHIRQGIIPSLILWGPPGIGKTTLANIIAKETGTKIFSTSGPALEKSADLMGILTNLSAGDILFIDEIHRLPIVIEEFLYPALEDFKIDFIVDKGAFAKTPRNPTTSSSGR